MSNRLTFSLASLVLIFALAFVAMPAMAADGGPTIEMEEYTGKRYTGTGTATIDHVQARNDFRVKVKFSHLVTDFATDDVTLKTAASLTSLLTTVAGTPVSFVSAPSDPDSPAAGNIPSSELTDNKVFVLQLNLGDDQYNAGYMVVRIAEDKAFGAEGAVDGLGNQPGSFASSNLPKQNDWTVTATVRTTRSTTGTDAPADLALTAADLDKDDKLKATAVFEMKFTFSGGTGAVPDLDSDANSGQIQLRYEDDTAVTGINTTSLTQQGLVTTARYTVDTAQTKTPIFIGVNPQWANASPTGGLRIPAAAPVDPTITTQPTAEIMISDHNATDRTFRIQVTFTPGEKSDGSAADVTPGADFHTAVIKGTDSGSNTVNFTKEDAVSAKNSYTGILKYNLLSTPPLTIKLLQSGTTYYKDTSTPTMDATVGVGGPPTTPGNNAPAFASDTATRSIAENTAAGMSIGAAVAATDADGDTLTYTLGGTDAASFAIVSTSGQLQTKAALDYETKTSYMVTVTAADGNGGTDSIDVTIDVTDVDDTTDPPTATITVSDHKKVGVKGTFNVRVEFTTATGGSPVTGFDHTKLTVMDSSTPAKAVTVMPAVGTVANPIDPPLKANNLYDGTLQYDTRNQFTYPLKVTINQTVQKTHNPTHSADVGKATDPPAKAEATFSGTLSLTEQSIITITFDKAVTALTAADLNVMGGSVAFLQVKPNLTAAMANKVWEVAIDPDNNPFTESITVTIASTSTIAEPAATMGSLTTAVPKGTISSITPATGANDQAAFIVDFTFAAVLPDGVSLTANDLKVTPTTAKVGTPAPSVANSKVWQVLITPTKGMNTTIALSDAGKLKFAYAGAAITVMKKAAAPTVGVIGAVYNSATMTTTLSGRIGANGFVVIPEAGLPDIQQFFNIGGSITLDDSDATDDKNSRTVVISEILWGYDLGMRAVQPLHKGYQFIELYNTTGAIVDLTGWQLKFVHGRTIPAIDIDQVSNRQGAGWDLSAGQNGRIYNTTAQNPLNRIAGVEIISMYREINYYHIEVTHKANRAELLKQISNGNASGSWKASEHWTSNPWVRDSKGRKHLKGATFLPGSGIIGATSVPRDPFVINEIGNSAGKANDWVELRNTSTTDQHLKNYQLSVVTKDKKDTKIFSLESLSDGANHKVPPGGVVVITSTHPKDNDLASGLDLRIGVNDNVKNQVLKGLTHLYVVQPFANGIPDGTDKTLLILRNNHEAKHLTTANQIVDVVGTLSIADNTRGTSLWPLNATGAPHGNVIDGTDHEDFRAGKVYRRANAGGGTGEKHLAVVGYTGVGYDRHAAASGQNNNGTPGYANDAVKGEKSNWMGQVTISEIMLVTEEGAGADRVPRATRLPQWFEIYNASMTEAVSLNDWYLEIQNTNENFATFDFKGNLHATLRLKNVIVQPNQTVLVVSGSGLNSGNFPEQRTINVFTDVNYRKELGITSRGEPILNPKGFYIQLRDHKNNHVDEVGNLGLRHDAAGRTGVGRRDESVDTWEIASLDSLRSNEGHRTSLIRIYDNKVARSGLNKPGGPKDTTTSWVLAAKTNFRNVPSLTYFGNHRDFGTPGYRGGGPLPVSLSKFRPERLKETGEVVIRWVTESELNNAGFNILRSDTRGGDYTKLNNQLIAGQGTTSERTAYTYTDTSAKPNVAYYYQIQDVSLDGQVNTLRVNRLKGHVNAAGKATTTWGELKALQ